MNKKTIVKSFFKILISFVLFYAILFTFNRTGFPYIEKSFSQSKYAFSLMAEIIAFFFITLFLFITGKKKVFLEKGEGFFKSIGLGVSLLIFIVILTFSGFITILQDGSVHLPNLIASFLLCLFIGLFEEFLCRGWLLNSFLEKIGKNRKGVLLSIFLSALLFGGMHFTNVLSGQSIFMTVIQVCQALMIGMVLGILYFRTKNIWAVAFLHTFYDFGSFLSDVNTLKDCTYASVLPTSYYLYMIWATLIICGFYLLSFLILSRKTKMNDLLEEKEELTKADYDKDERKKLLCSLGMIAIWVLQALVPIQFDTEEIQVCYSYQEREVAKHVVSYYFQDTYHLDYSFYQDIGDSSSFENLFQTEELHYSYSFLVENGAFLVVDEGEKETYSLDENVLQYLVYEDDARYVVFYTKYVDEDSILYYLQIPKEELTKDYGLLSFFKDSSFMSYILPDIKEIGTYQEIESNFIYPYVVSYANDAFIVTEDSQLFVLKK